MSARRTALAAGLLVAAATPARAQKAQWTDVLYVPGRWAAGRIAPAPAGTDSLAMVARVDCFDAPPRWRAEIRRSTDGLTLAPQPDVLIGNGATVVVVTPLGATPLEQHALGRDPLVRAALQAFDASGHRAGPPAGRQSRGGGGGGGAYVAFRRPARSAAFDDALLNPGGGSGGRNLLASNIRAVGDQRSASVVATAGARGVDRVNTPHGQVAVTPDTMAVVRMERYTVGSVALEEFMRAGGLGAYAVRADSARRP